MSQSGRTAAVTQGIGLVQAVGPRWWDVVEMLSVRRRVASNEQCTTEGERRVEQRSHEQIEANNEGRVGNGQHV